MKKSVGKLFCFNIFFASLPNGRQYVDDGDKGNDGVIELQELLHGGCTPWTVVVAAVEHFPSKSGRNCRSFVFIQYSTIRGNK